MTETNNFEIIEEQIETVIEEQIEIVKKRKPHKVKRNPERYLADGTYNSKPLDPDYFKKYWREHSNKEYKCPICEKVIFSCDKIKRHEKSRFCLRAQALLENLN